MHLSGGALVDDGRGHVDVRRGRLPRQAERGRTNKKSRRTGGGIRCSRESRRAAGCGGGRGRRAAKYMMRHARASGRPAAEPSENTDRDGQGPSHSHNRRSRSAYPEEIRGGSWNGIPGAERRRGGAGRRLF